MSKVEVNSDAVSEGHLTMAQRFSVGFNGKSSMRPEGTAECDSCPSAAPFGTHTARAVEPNAEALGYSRMSLRGKALPPNFRLGPSDVGLRQKVKQLTMEGVTP